MSIASDLLEINDVKLAIKSAIELQGVSTTGVSFTDYADKILEIDSTSGCEACDISQPTWTKPSAWPDIAAIFAASTMPNKRWIVLFIAGSDTWSNINFGASTSAGSRTFETSDGGIYTTTNLTHVWNPAMDIDGGDGTKLRWLIVGNNNSTGLSIGQMSSAPSTWGPVWVYCGSGTYNSISPGHDTVSANANHTLRCFEMVSPAAFTGSTFAGQWGQMSNLECVRYRMASTISTFSADMRSCIKLYELPFASTITTFSGSFAGCRLLKIELPSGLTSMAFNGALGSMWSMCKLDLPSGLTTLPANGLFSDTLVRIITVNNVMAGTQSFAQNNLYLEQIIWGSGTFGTIGQSAFSGCQALDDVIMPDTITSINANAFDGCRRLKTLHLSTALTSIGSQAFNNCTSLRDVTLPSGLTSLGNNAFDSSNVKSLVIPTGVTALSNHNTLEVVRYLGNVTSGSATAHNNASNMFYLSFGTLDVAMTLSSVTQFTRQVLADILISLKNNVGIINRTLTIGSTNINRMTTAERAVATAKNWTLA